MKAIAYQEFGSTAVLQVTETSTPSLTSNQVLVKVKAVSINPMDWKIRKGEMKLMSGSKFPRSTGVDFAGIVADTGSAVTHLKKGDEVFGLVQNTMKDGALAEYVAVPSTLIWKKPTHLSFAQAASVPMVGIAAATALKKMGNISSQTRILVNGASGGFGMVLLQLLRQTGADITAVASTGTIQATRKWGANVLIDYTKQDVFSLHDNYDIVIDLSGKMSYKNARKVMKRKALFLNTTPAPIEIPTSLFSNLFTGQKHIVVLSSASAEYMELLLDAINTGLQIEVSKTFPFAQFKEAYEYAEKGGYVGKVVIEMN